MLRRILRRKKEEPIRLEKKVGIIERIQNWTDRNRFYLIFLGSIVGLGLFIIFCFIFIPSGTESGLWYNHGGV